MKSGRELVKKLKRRCVVTGATGYIGSHVARYLLSSGWEVHVIVRTESKYTQIEKIKNKIFLFEYDGDIASLIAYFRKVQPDAVFHLAACVPGSWQPEQAAPLIRSNILFGTELLEAMSRSASRLFINTGTYWQNYDSADYNPADLYAATKEAFEKILKYYVEAYQFRAVTLRLYDVYGEDDKRPKLLNLLKEIAGTETVIDVSPGGQYVDLVHISDVCTAYAKAYEWLAANPSVKNEIYGVYTGEEIQVKELIPLFAEILGKAIHADIGGRPYKDREIMRPVKRYARVPGWQPDVTLENGLALFSRAVRGGVSRKYRPAC